MFDLAFGIVGLAIPIGMLLPFRLAYLALFKWQGGWRVAGLAPLAVLLVFFAPLAVDWSRDATSHNLWGLLFIPIGLLICAYGVVLAVLRRRFNARSLSLESGNVPDSN